MLCYFNSTNVEYRSYDNLKKFLCSTCTRICEKVKRPEPQAQKEYVSREFVNKLKDEIEEREARLVELQPKRQLLSKGQLADVMPSDDVTSSSGKKQIASEMPSKIFTLDEQKASNSEVL